MDIIVSSLALTLFSPFWILIAIAIKLTSRGPFLYITETVGKDGRVFRLYKFRTMIAEASEDEHKEWIRDFVKNNRPYATIREPNGDEKPVFKVIHDTRVTKIGAFLRRSGLDEVPQFINVLRGEMSIVGPRSPRVFEYEHYEEWQKARVSVLPGITGLYQITARSVVPFDEMVRIDLEYIRRRSVWLDLWIMLRTIPVMVFMKGGY